MMKTALTGVMSASRDLNVISNNLANALTVGFKRSTSQFVDVMGPSQNDRPSVDIGQGAIQQVVRRSNSQGTLKQTDSVLDLAMVGPGYFTFGDAPTNGATSTTTTDQTSLSYSRAGQLQVNTAGQLVDGQSGKPLLGVSALSGGMISGLPQPINLGAATGGDLSKIQTISIDPKGVVNVTKTDGTLTRVAAIAIARFNNDDGLKNLGGSSFAETDMSGAVELGRAGRDGYGAVQQGSLEQANVDMTAEMLHMIQAQQAYNSNARALQTGSEMLRSSIETLTR
jgi:hypothetical protein